MARGIPDVPLDGETYASVGVAGLPMVLEYDGPTGGYKLVVSTEAGVAINISGTVEITGGQLTVVGAAQYGEDTPHTSGQTGTFIMGVRQDALASAVSADGDYAGLQLDSLGRLRVLGYESNFLAPLNSSQYAEDSMFVGGMTGTFVLAVRNDQMDSYAGADGDFSTLNTDIFGRLYTWTTGSYVFADTELSAAVALADNLANPTAGGVGAYNLGYDPVDGTWRRVRVDPETFGLLVSITGTVSTILETGDIEIGAVEIKDSDSDIRTMVGGLTDSLPNPTGVYVGAFNMGWDVGNGDWGRMQIDAPAASLSAAYVSRSLASLAILHAFNTGSSYSRLEVHPLSDVVAGNELNYALSVGSYLMGFDPSYSSVGNWQRVQINPATNGLLVTITGSVDTELPAAVVLADAMANPTVPQVGGHLMGYNGATWDRLYMGISGSLAVDLISQLDAINDEVTAYVTGTLTVDTELPSAVVLSDGMATPTPPAVGAFGMGYDPVADDWNRIRLDAVTGAQLVGITGTVSVAVESDLPLVVTEDEVTAYITGSTSLNLMGKTITRVVIDFSGSVASETALVAAIGGQQIKVLEAMLIGNTDVTIFFQSGFTGTALTGPMSLPADGDGFFVETPAQIEAHHFETLSGEALVLDVDANVLLGGWLNYYAE
ncbi:MAG: hypothetical protein K940chlam2_00040 [Chlamydiae bacterium]|nr:hypothetical protein [Chlamydiota bacterium]